MEPPIGTSVRQLKADYWILGSSRICERITSSADSKSLVTWNDGNETYCIRELRDNDELIDATPATGLVYEAGTSAATWTLGQDTFCKVKAWCAGMESESATIDFVKQKASCIPLPEVIYSWTDHAWNRSFLLLKRVPGQTLLEAWPGLSTDQRVQVADQVATYCSTLAEITSLNFQGATGGGIVEPFLQEDDDPSHPSWLPRPLGPLSIAEFSEHVHSNFQGFNIGSVFHFYHADLGPTNIIISENGSIQAILDWESAGFYPRLWIASKPMFSAGFFLDSPDWDEKLAWSNLLSSRLERMGYKPDLSIVAQARG